MVNVSIIMPCFNDGAYIEEAIQSVLNQTYKDIEIIVINDGSTDEFTNNLLKENMWGSKVKLIDTAGVGPAGARNIGISQARGKYILPVDSDDRIECTYVQKAIDIMKQNDKVGVVYCQAELFGEQSGRWDLPNYSLEKMLLDNIVFVTAMFYKEDWEKVNGFNEKMKNGMEDYDFWLSILETEKEIYQIPEVLFFYRIKPVSRTTRFQKSMEQVVDTYRQIYKNHPILYSRYKALYANILRDELIHQLFLNRALKESIGCIDKIEKIPFLKQIINRFIVKRS